MTITDCLNQPLNKGDIILITSIYAPQLAIVIDSKLVEKDDNLVKRYSRLKIVYIHYYKAQKIYRISASKSWHTSLNDVINVTDYNLFSRLNLPTSVTDFLFIERDKVLKGEYDLKKKKKNG